MASIKRSGKRWRAQLYRDGVRESKSFDTKAEAQQWANTREPLLTAAKPPDKTLDDALVRYRDEKAPSLGAKDWALRKIKFLRKQSLAKHQLDALSGPMLAAWRDRRQGVVPSSRAPVGPATVNRELNLLHAVLTAAVEWGWISVNPLKGVKRPDNPPSRKRRVTDAEIEAVTKALGYESGPPANLSQRVALAFQFAIETAMRGGEIVRLQWAHVGERSVLLPKTKNGDARSVPLSSRARGILDALKPVTETAFAFALTDAQRDALFRKGRIKAKVHGLTFHDSRAEAIWRLSKKLDVLELARVIGHRNLASLLLYYNASADELADKLD